MTMEEIKNENHQANGLSNNFSLIFPSLGSSLAVILTSTVFFVLHQLDVHVFLISKSWFPLLALTAFFIFFVYYYLYIVQIPVLYIGSGKYRTFLVQNCPSINELYWPTPWFLPSHISSVVSHLIRMHTLKVPKCSIDIVQLSDGGEVALHWKVDDDTDTSKPIALFIAGVHGDSATAYMRFMIKRASKIGYRCVVFHNRGLGGAAIKTPRLYCGANVDDLKEALKQIKRKYPDSPIFATGCSLGGLHVTRYLIEVQEKSLIDYAMTISVPWDSFIASSSMESSKLNLILNKFLVAKSLAMVKRSQHLFEELDYLDMDHIFESHTYRELDERFTTKIFGFRDINHHYQEQSVAGKLFNIKIPLLSLSSSDDHFSPLSSLPCDECSKQNNIALVVTSWGGHISFMDGLIPKAPFLMDRLFSQYALAIMPKLKTEIMPSQSI